MRTRSEIFTFNPDDLHFHVREYSPDGKWSIMAASNNIDIAIAAYQAAIGKTKLEVALCQRARVIESREAIPSNAPLPERPR